MGKLWKKIPLMVRIRIAFGAIIASIILVGLDIANIATLVSRNYLVSSASSPALSRSAFIYNYSVRTGDNTLALLTGTDISVRPVGGVSGGMYSDDDLRNLVKSICSTWINQSDTTGDFTQAEKEFAQKLLSSGLSEGTKLSTSQVNQIEGLYTTADSQYYTFTSKEGTYNIDSCRCCCCLSEMVASILTGKEVSKGHSLAIGLTCEATDAVKDSVYAYDVQYPLNTYYDCSDSVKIEELVNNGTIRVGTVFLYVYKNGAGSYVRHIDIVTYIDKSAKKLYIAGAGDSENIMLDALWGYNSIKSYDGDLSVKDFDSSSRHLINILHYTESYAVTGGK